MRRPSTLAIFWVLQPLNLISSNGKEWGGGVIFFAAEVSKKRHSRHAKRHAGHVRAAPPRLAFLKFRSIPVRLRPPQNPKTKMPSLKLPVLRESTIIEIANPRQ